MRYRDLETGTFLTPDPLGYADGPNRYCYVQCHPITKFDPFGLKTKEDYEKEQDDARDKRDEEIDKIEKRWENRKNKEDNPNYQNSMNRIWKKFNRQNNRIQNKINKIDQTAASMAQALGDNTLMGAHEISTRLDDEDSNYKAYRRTDAFMNFMGTKKFAQHSLNGEYGQAAWELGKTEVRWILTYLTGKQIVKSVSGALPRSVRTPHGPAVQSSTAEARAALRQTRSGAPVYRSGKLGTQHGAEGQFWSFKNPASTSGYSGKMGMPSGGTGQSFMMGGRVNSASSVITRPAPGIGSNAGGAMEAVTSPGGVSIDWFHMP